MSRLVDLLDTAKSSVDRYNNEEVPASVFDVIAALVDAVEALKEALDCPTPVVASMSRAEALETARQHVEAMSTKANGYQDVRLSDKVQAVDRLARFLMGESE